MYREHVGRTVRIWAGIGHREDASTLVLELGDALVLEGLSPQGLASVATPRGITALYHEVPEQPMEADAAIIVLLTEADEVLAGHGHQVHVKLEVQIPVGRLQLRISLLLL